MNFFSRSPDLYLRLKTRLVIRTINNAWALHHIAQHGAELISPDRVVVVFRCDEDVVMRNTARRQ